MEGRSSAKRKTFDITIKIFISVLDRNLLLFIVRFFVIAVYYN